MSRVFICDYIRTPIGRFGGALSGVRTDDLAAHPVKALMARNSRLDWAQLDDLVLGCANQAGEDNRNVARMAVLLAGLPETVPGVTVNRLCGSGMDAVMMAARTIRGGEADLMIAGGVESMSRAPQVIPKATVGFSRVAEIYDTTIGWRFINPLIHDRYGTEAMAETAENIAAEIGIGREAQDAFAWQSQRKALAAQTSGRLAAEIAGVPIPGAKGAVTLVDKDEHPRETTLHRLAALRPIVRDDGTVTAGNASGLNDGAAAMLIASEAAVKAHGLTPLAEVLGARSAGVAPRLMGLGPVPAVKKLCTALGLTLDAFDHIEVNEAFAVQVLGVLSGLNIAFDDPRINPNGGAIALGHPLGMSGARIIGSAALDLAANKANLALCTMCVGVGQGLALALRR